MFNIFIIYEYDTENKNHTVMHYLNLILLSTRDQQNNTIPHKFGFV